MNDQLPHLFQRLLLFTVVLLIAFVAYQSFASELGMRSIKRQLDDAATHIKLH